MYLDQAKKQEIFGQYGKSNTDTGSAESQIALFSYRISHLTEHLKKNRKDYTTARSLTQLVGSAAHCLTICTTATSIATVLSSRPSASVSNTHKALKLKTTQGPDISKWKFRDLCVLYGKIFVTLQNFLRYKINARH